MVNVSSGVGLMLGVWLMSFLGRFESSRDRAFGNAAHALAEVLRGPGHAVGRQAFRFSLAGGFVVDFADRVFGGVETLRCGSLGTALQHSAGVADQLILDVGTG